MAVPGLQVGGGGARVELEIIKLTSCTRKSAPDRCMKEWITILVFTFYGSLVGIKAAAVEPNIESILNLAKYVWSLISCLIFLGTPADEFGFLGIAWIVTWLPFFAIALLVLNKTQRLAHVTYSSSLLGVAMVLSFILPALLLLFFADTGPDDPREAVGVRLPIWQILLQFTIATVMAAVASAFVANRAITVGSAPTECRRAT
jgi:hypothetical protein